MYSEGNKLPMSTQDKTTNTITALSVAEYFLERAKSENKKLTNKKIQKLVYYAQAWSLVANDEPLFSEKIEAWVHGPVIPSLYEHFKVFGFGPILHSATSASDHFSKKQVQLLNDVWKVYGKYDAEYLELLTHSELPWQKAREGISDVEHSSNRIDLEVMKEFYATKK